MSKFFKALEQARQDRALRQMSGANGAPLPPAPRPAPPTESLRTPWGTSAAEAAADSTDDIDERLVSLVSPAAFEAEQYRALRHTIDQRRRTTSSLQVMAVSSPCPGDGKTITAMNLAGAFAQAPELRVLLIDADLRRPSVGRFLGRAPGFRPGLVDAIVTPELTLSHVTETLAPFNLSVIHAGQTPSTPYELLKSPKLGKLMEDARRHYDYVVIDTPPLIPIQDCRAIGRWVDGFVVVVAAHRTSRRHVADALTTLDRNKVLGFVFNEDDRWAAGAYPSYAGVDHRLAPSPRGALMRAVGRVGDSLRRRGRGTHPRRSRSGGAR